MIGAFRGQRLVGVGILRPEIQALTSQLVYLQVSNGYRRMGVGGHLLQEVIYEAKRSGAGWIGVSVTPSASAVRFYLKRGFQLAEDPIPELADLEPEDIQMIKQLA